MRKNAGKKYTDSWAEDRDYESFENPKGARRKEIVKEYGSVDNWREKQMQDYMQEDKAKLEEKMRYFQDGEASAAYEKSVIGKMEKDYKKTVQQYSDYDNDIKPNELYQLQKQSAKDMTTEDFAILNNSYYHSSEAYGSSYTDYTKKKINGEELNWSQKRLEQIVDEHSVVMPGGRTVFRKTSEEEFKALTGKSLSDFDNNAPVNERTATLTKCTSFGTALQYDSFKNSNVLIEYTTKNGAKAFFSTNTEECEGIFPPGTKITNIKVVGSSNKKVPTIFRKGENVKNVYDGKTVEAAAYKESKYGKSAKGYDFTYNGKGEYNDYIKTSSAKAAEIMRNPELHNPNYNQLVRVVVEVE